MSDVSDQLSISDQLSGVLTQVAVAEPWTLTDEQVRDVTRIACQVRSGVDALLARLAASVDGRGIVKDDGHTSTTAWLADAGGMSRREASRLVSLGRVVDDTVLATRQAWASGFISSEQAGIIARSIGALPDWFGDTERADAEQVLLETAPEVTVEHLRMLGNHVIEVLDPDGADEHIGKQLEAEEKKAHEGTTLRLSDNGHGVTHLRGQIPTAQADMFRTHLEALSSPRRQSLRTTPDPVTGDSSVHSGTVIANDSESLGPESLGPHGEAALGHPNHGQRLGWAFLEYIEHMPSDKLPQAGGVPATVTIEIDLKALKSQMGTAGLSSGGEMSAAQARRLACNANLIPMIMDGKSKVLDLSVTRRLHDRYQRHAIIKRDKGCCWKGCDRPSSWCEVHHPEPFGTGGETTVDNGALFCFLHHHLLHDAGWSAVMASDGVIEVIPPARVDPRRRPLRHARHIQLRPIQLRPRAA